MYFDYLLMSIYIIFVLLKDIHTTYLTIHTIIQTIKWYTKINFMFNHYDL
uniref:Uncharacterized protein n=1 Tax=Arundo donax TaxID=35708 RepID=A0A0A9G253_ARUDO